MKKVLSVALILLIFAAVFSTTVFAGVTGDVPIFSDKTGLVSSADIPGLTVLLNEVSDKYEVVVSAVIVDSLEGKSPRDFADDYYDYNNFAYDGNPDGVMLLISVGTKDWYITTTGKCIDYFTDGDIDDIGDEMLSSLSSGKYAESVRVFTEECDMVIYDATHFSSFYIVVSVIIGLIIGLISVSSMKGKMRTVRYRTEADDYMRKGSLSLTDQRDAFLYRNVRRVKRETSSGSSTHRGSSGRSHGGGGGKF